MDSSSSDLSKSLVEEISIQLNKERSAIKIQALARGYRQRRGRSHHRLKPEVGIHSTHGQTGILEAKTSSSDKDSPTESIESVGTMAQLEVRTILREKRAAVVIQALVRGVKCRKTVRPLIKTAPPKAQHGNLQTLMYRAHTF
jgi:hypothetical protein